ncbi:MAG: endonuclease/exonuclease/phosphatase family protein [Cellulomonas sp.]
MAVAALLAVLRAGEPGSRRDIEIVAFTPVGLLLALVGIVAAALLVRRLPALALVAGASAVVLAVLHAWWLAPLYVGTVPRAGDGPELVVLTQNFEDGDPRALGALARQNEVDVLVITDAPPEQAAAVGAVVGSTLPFTTLGNGAGTVVWSRFPITSDTFISDGGESRRVTLHVPDSAPLDLVAVHPSPPYQEDGAKWIDDWHLIHDHLMRAYGGSADHPVLVVGDFNATRDHAPMRDLEEMGFRDAGEQLNQGLVATWPANWKQRRLGLPIPTLLGLDHVLTSGGLVPTEVLVSDAAGSDHRGVIATVAAPPR